MARQSTWLPAVDGFMDSVGPCGDRVRQIHVVIRQEKRQ
jgi:hypothetical protein